MPARAALALLATAIAVAPAPAAAQTPVAPFQVEGRYATFHVHAQVTGPWTEGRDLLFHWGRMHTVGDGRWMAQLEGGAGMTTGDSFIDRFLAGPRVSLARAFPGQHLEITSGSRGEPYLLVTGAGYGVADVQGENDFGFAGGVGAGVGLRVFGDEWDTSLAHVEVLLERRFGFRAGHTELFVRVGRAVPVGRRRAR
jgi:hypothetical protein